MVELLGIIASIFMVFSLILPSTSARGNISMRILNIIASALFVVYGCLIPAFSTALLNSLTIIINIINIVKIKRKMKDND
jgi:hypothetical protein